MRYAVTTENIGKIIKQIRNDLNMSQVRFAKKIDVTDKAISSWERGQNVPTFRTLQKIVNV